MVTSRRLNSSRTSWYLYLSRTMICCMAPSIRCFMKLKSKIEAMPTKNKMIEKEISNLDEKLFLKQKNDQESGNCKNRQRI